MNIAVLGHNEFPMRLEMLAGDAKSGIAAVERGEDEEIKGWLAYGAALNEGRALFPKGDNERFSEWVGKYQLDIWTNGNEIKLFYRNAAMWAAANAGQFAEAKEASNARTVRGIYAKWNEIDAERKATEERARAEVERARAEVERKLAEEARKEAEAERALAKALADEEAAARKRAKEAKDEAARIAAKEDAERQAVAKAEAERKIKEAEAQEKAATKNAKAAEKNATAADKKADAADKKTASAKAESEILAAAKAIRAKQASKSREARLGKIDEISRGNQALDVSTTFPVIYADPPWRYENPPLGGGNREIENHYPTMSLEEICALPVSEMAAQDAMLYLWATAPKLEECFQVITAWGFEYRTHMVWDKEKIGMGYHARSQHELLLICKRGEIPPPEPGTQPSSVYREARGPHSAKPAFFHEMIEGFYPNLAKIELFCRSPREGWTVWGNQSGGQE